MKARLIRSGSEKPTAAAMLFTVSVSFSTRTLATSALRCSTAFAGVSPISALKARANWRGLKQATSANLSTDSEPGSWLAVVRIGLAVLRSL
jgi:hypothetical protein